MGWSDYIYMLRGVLLPLLFHYDGQCEGLLERNEQGVAPRFSLIAYLYFAIMESMAVKRVTHHATSAHR